MMVRRLIACAGALGLSVCMAAPLAAQEVDSPPTVLPEETEPTTVTPEGPTTVTPEETGPVQVLPDEAAPGAAAPRVITEGPQVAGDTVTRGRMARTGEDIGVAAMVGAGLTVAGVGMAAAARRRRRLHPATA